MSLTRLISALLLLNSTVALANDSEIYMHLNTLFTRMSSSENKITALESSLAALKAQVSNIPAPVKLEAGEGIRLEGNRIAVRFPRHRPGELYQGGLVFQVDESGQHGLIAALKDATDDGLAWRNGASGNKTTNARADGIYAGDANTRLIVAAQTMDNQKGQFAALAAMTFQVAEDGLSPCTENAACYGSWYLPSAYELTLLYKNLVVTGLLALPNEAYWSSTEQSVSSALLFSTSEAAAKSAPKAATTAHVRPISRF